jgi:predicted nuclease of predicted toxin-antitoxin system
VTIWLDNHLSPSIASWLEEQTGEPCRQVRDLGLARATDREIFDAARQTVSVFITKDRDFAELVGRLGPPPAIILLSCGNTSTDNLRRILAINLSAALAWIRAGEPLVEIGGAGPNPNAGNP